MYNPEQIKQHVEALNSLIPDSKVGLPQDVFFFVSRMTPLVNVDLLVKNERNQVLLTWRHDEFYHGWHIAGGILRFKEKFSDRIQAVAQKEFGASVDFDPAPIAVHEKFNSTRDIRGHFIAFLYKCKLSKDLDPKMECLDLKNPKHGQWMWHTGCPDNLIRPHDVYRKYIEA